MSEECFVIIIELNCIVVCIVYMSVHFGHGMVGCSVTRKISQYLGEVLEDTSPTRDKLLENLKINDGRGCCCLSGLTLVIGDVVVVYLA